MFGGGPKACCHREANCSNGDICVLSLSLKNTTAKVVLHSVVYMKWPQVVLWRIKNKAWERSSNLSYFLTSTQLTNHRMKWAWTLYCRFWKVTEMVGQTIFILCFKGVSSVLCDIGQQDSGAQQRCWCSLKPPKHSWCGQCKCNLSL